MKKKNYYCVGSMPIYEYTFMYMNMMTLLSKHFKIL